MTLTDRYKRANEALHPTHRAVERALSGEKPRKKRRPLRVALPAAVAAVLAVALLVNGVPGLGGGTIASAAYAWPSRLPRPAPNAGGAHGGQRGGLGAVQRRLQRLPGRLAGLPKRGPRSGRAGRPASPPWRTSTAGSTALALAGEGNGVYSPVSLWFALAMLAETTEGDSRREILDALGAEDVEQLRAWADTLWHALYTDDGTASVLLGTSMWLNEGVDFNQDTLDALAGHYYAGSYQVPMGTGEAIRPWLTGRRSRPAASSAPRARCWRLPPTP